MKTVTTVTKVFKTHSTDGFEEVTTTITEEFPSDADLEYARLSAMRPLINSHLTVD